MTADWDSALLGTPAANLTRLARERDQALGGEQRLQDLLDRAYDERDALAAAIRQALTLWDDDTGRAARKQGEAILAAALNCATKRIT